MKLLDRLNERVVFGAVLFTILIGNPMRVIVGEMQKPAPQPEPTMTITSPALGISITQTESQWKKVINSPEYAASLKKAAAQQKAQAVADEAVRVDAQRRIDKMLADQAATTKKLAMEREAREATMKAESEQRARESIEAAKESQKVTEAWFPTPQTQAERDYNDSREDCNGDPGCKAARH